MPVLLSDETWARIEKMLEDYESGVLRVIPGVGMKYEEQTTAKANCPGTKMGTFLGSLPASNLLNVSVCINNVATPHTFVITR